MKRKILEALKTKYKNLGFSEKAFDGVAAFLEPSVKEDADIETAIAGVEGMLKAFQSEADKLRTDKTTAEKKLAELDAKVKELGGTPSKEPEEQHEVESKETPAWAKAILDSNKTLSDKIAALEGEKISTSRKQKLDAITNKLPENLRKSYARTPVKDLSDDEFENLTSEIAAEVDGIVKEVQAKGAVFGRPAAQGSQNQNGALTKEQESAISHRDVVPKDGQPF